MDNKDYTKFVTTLENTDFDGIKERLDNTDILRLLHSGLGICTEAGEFLDMLKKHIYYGKELDLVNLKEELGDQIFYIFVALDTLKTTYEEIIDRNVEKLSARYPDGFSEDKALNRDLEKEREILEK